MLFLDIEANDDIQTGKHHAPITYSDMIFFNLTMFYHKAKVYCNKKL